MFPFQNLDALTDLRGYPLRSGYRKGTGSGESRGGRGSRRQQQSGEQKSPEPGVWGSSLAQTGIGKVDVTLPF